MKLTLLGMLISLVVLKILAEVSSEAKVENPLKGKHFRVAHYFQPGSSVLRDKNGTIVSFTGPPLVAANWLAQRLGFTYDVVLVQNNWLDPFPNGSWGGCYGLLANKEVDFVFAGMPLSHVVLSIADFTATLHEEPVIMALPTPREENRFLAPVKPFSLPVWMALLCTVFAVCLSIIAIDAAARGNNRQEEFNALLMHNLRLLFGQGGFEGSRYTLVIKRMALAGWLLSVLVLVNAYTGSFISVATTPRLVKQPQTLQEAVDQSEYKFTLAQKARTELYLNATSGYFRALGEQVKRHPENFVPTAQDAFSRVLSGCCFMAYPKLGIDMFLYNDYQTTGECRSVLSKTPWSWDFYAFAALKGSPYTSFINKELLLVRLKDYGLYSRWLASSLKKPLKCSNPAKPKVRPLKLVDVASVFVILLLGLGLSCVVFVCEFSSAPKTKKSGLTEAK